MSDNFERRRTQTFTNAELDAFYTDAALYLEQEDLIERLGIELDPIHIDRDESGCEDATSSNYGSEDYDTYIITADKLNPFSLIIAKEEDFPVYFRFSRPEDLSELKDDIKKWIWGGEQADLDERAMLDNFREVDENRKYD